MRKFEIWRRVLPSVPPIIFRNFFVLVNGIIFAVIVLLFVFGNGQAGLFLGIIFLLNTFIGAAQDIRARVVLERLQMLTALRVTRINKDQTESLIFAEEILKGDLIKLSLGDQTPCEGILIGAENLEISEALVTGESDSFPKKEGDKIIAGAIVTAGHAIMKAENIFRESRLSKIAGEAKNFLANPSSIQLAINTVIKYTSYVLIPVILFVIIRGIYVHSPRLDIVTTAGAITSTLVPQGLVVAITILFAIGAAYYSRKDVLFQEINSTEKLGRIKNLCIDKTGTLTDNVLLVEEMHTIEGFKEEEARALVYKCITGLTDSSQTALAVKNYLEKYSDNDKAYLEGKEVVEKLSFSSWRRYGGIEVKEKDVRQSVFLGAPDVFSPRVSNVVEKKWLENIAGENAQMGKRVLCVARASETGLLKDISETHLSIIAIFVFHNKLRPGIEKAIEFFNQRGMKIRVLSGDGKDTVRIVAESVGINGAENIITGKEIKEWNDSDFATLAHQYTVFAEVLPEHKVKLIEAFRKDGFTAMVGDGVNDALAMKKSDLGIAMWDGSCDEATRRCNFNDQ